MQQQSIAVGIVFNQHQQVLIAKRNDKQHLAGHWEFPGGKLERGESFKLALRRELFEEIGIELTSAIKILETHHTYDELNLNFQFFKVAHYLGDITPEENQQLRWVNLEELSSINFPSANKAVIDALTLPSHYMIADEYVSGSFIVPHVEKQLKQGVKLIQHRATESITQSEYVRNGIQIKKLCEKYHAAYVANCCLQWLDEIKPDAIHLSSNMLRQIAINNITDVSFQYLSASCHNEQELKLANKIGVRSVILGSVNASDSHPNGQVLGWKRFNELCCLANQPVYAIGGLTYDDYKVAQIYGAQGVAAIRAFI